MTPPPVLLRPDNFTSPERTPWAGSRIASVYKSGAVPLSTGAVGESWEVSLDPELPSSLYQEAIPLSAWIARDPLAVLGEEARRGRRGTALLVKLIDTAEPLSLQIHPPDAYPRLRAGESGKPEVWYVLHARPGAGVHVGFRKDVGEAQLRDAIARGADLSALLRFVAVEPGDAVVIDPGMPHAIGAGLSLIEPQHVVPGRRGITYRYWDWNRRYRNGRPDPDGEPRPLHLEDALAVTDWTRQSDPDLPLRVYRRLGFHEPDAPARADRVCGPGAGDALCCAHLEAWRIHGSGRVGLPDRPLLRSLSVLEGRLRIQAGSSALEVPRGFSAVVPAAQRGVALELARAHAVSACVAFPAD